LAEYGATIRKRREQIEKRGSLLPPDRRLELAGVPLEIRLKLQKPDDTRAVMAAREFVSDASKRYLLFLGSVGLGKSVAAGFVLLEAVMRFAWDSIPSGVQPCPALWVQAHRLTRVTAWEKADQELLGLMERATWLVVDDMGDEATKAGTDLLAAKLIERCATRRRTVMTTNLTSKAFIARYGEALADRIREQGVIPSLSGASLRTRSQKPPAESHP
jgi:DNA replication protein DnaC